MFRSVLLSLFLSAYCHAVVITNIGVVVGKVTAGGPSELIYSYINATNPAVPLTFSPVTVDGTGWTTNGDPVAVSTLEITGFDLPIQKIKVDFSCVRTQLTTVPIPLAFMECDVTSIVEENGPTVLGADVDLDINKFAASENGAIINSLGLSSVPLLATASGTGAKVAIVSEPGTWTMLLGGALFLGLVGFRRLGIMQNGG